jgi:hypothetical protein
MADYNSFQEQYEIDKLRKAFYAAMEEAPRAPSELSISTRLSNLENKVNRILEFIEKLADNNALKALINCNKPKQE